jgi:hypothetical protein
VANSEDEERTRQSAVKEHPDAHEEKKHPMNLEEGCHSDIHK